MSIEFHCPQCRQLLRVADETEGKTARCPACGTYSRVPGRATGVAGESPFQASNLPPIDAETAENPYAPPSTYASAAGPVYSTPTATDGRATASFLLGIIGIMSSCCGGLSGLALPISLVGLVLGILVLRSGNPNGRGHAIAGVILCGLHLLLPILIIVAVASFVLLDVGAFKLLMP